MNTKKWLQFAQRFSRRTTFFVSIYYRPLRDKTHTRNHGWIAHLHDVYPREQKHYGGDFNLQHQTWGYAQSSNGAEDLIGEMQTFRLQLANKKGTKTRLGGAGQKDTTPDLSWTTNQYIQHQKWKCLPDPWGSDHFPIIFEFSPTKKVKNMTKKRVAKTVHWDRFRDVLREDKSEESSFESLLNSALQAATIKTNVEEDAPNPDIFLLNLWAKRLQAVQKYRKGYKTPLGRQAITRATVEAKVYAQKLDSRRWLDYSASLSDKTSITKLWATSRALLGKKKTKGATQTLALKLNKSEEHQQDTLQAGLDTIEAHLCRVKMQASPEKTNYTVIAPKRHRLAKIAEQLNLVLAGKRIEPSTSVKILGITIEETGKADIWLQDTLKHCNSALNAIRRICSARGGASEEIARRMVKALVVSRVCYGARHYWLTKAQWQKLEALNNQAKRIITGLPKFCPLGKLNEHAQINSLHETVVVRTVAHGERLKHTRQGRRILELLLRCTGDLPKLPQELPPWEDHAEITDNKPSTRKGDKKQQDRLARAHIKMTEAWEEGTNGIVAAYTDTASIDGPVTLKTAAVIFPTLGTSATKNLPARTSVKGGELAAVRLALETALALPEPPPEHIRIFTDSQEVVKECRKSRSPSVDVRNIKKLASLLLARGTTTRIAWVPAHAGIPGNEEVHRLARASLLAPRERDDTPSLQDHDHGYAPVRDRAPASRAREEDCNDGGYDPGEERAQIKQEHQSTLWEKLPPTPNPPLPTGFGRRAKVLLTRIRTDTTLTPARIASWSRGKRSGTCTKCNMGAKADTFHLLWECPKYKITRSKHRPSNVASLEGWTHPPGEEDNKRSILRSLIDFIFEANLDIFI
ncbi:uncharacterized protein LOC121836478 [Ixodes scapularis]|uniref:uncharacterized protein LOC121836478 n=1 Tax=Ixodes scapularis TaxID=6945 RepID=UPI001C3917E0|nr:uncharacterized protein LOC121836478 [Ixodes scapularis]